MLAFRLLALAAFAVALLGASGLAIAQETDVGFDDPLGPPSLDDIAGDPGVGPLRGSAASDAAVDVLDQSPGEEVTEVGSLAQPAAAVSIRDEAAEIAEAYDPQGIRFGGLTLLPSLTLATGWTDNADRAPVGEDDVFVRTRAEALLRAILDSGDLEATVGAGYTHYLDGSPEDEPSVDFALRGRFDIDGASSLLVTANASHAREDAGDPEIGEADDAGAVTVFGGSLAYERTAGLVGLSAGVSGDRAIYDEDPDRSNTVGAVSLRASLDSGAMIEPFVEASGFRRFYDRTEGADGFRRSSIGGELRAGVAIDTGITTGSLAVGYALERPDDGDLDDIEGLVVDGDIAWAPSDLTTVRLLAETSFEPTTLEGASGSVLTLGELAVTHDFLRNVSLTVAGRVSLQEYAGIERELFTAGARAEAAWRLNNTTEFTLSAGHERGWGSGGADDYGETTVEAGVTLRR